MNACVSCGKPVDTPFCPWCGERRPDDRHSSMRAFFEETVPALVDVDGRLVRSLRALFDRPGELTIRYMRGERVNWIPPLRVFLVMNVLFFLASGVYDIRSLDSTLHVQLTYQWYSPWIQAMVERRVAERGTTLDRYGVTFDALTAVQARSLVILMVPMFAAALAIVNVRLRRPAMHHIAHALHTLGAILGLMVATWSLIYLAAVALYLVAGYRLRLGDGGSSILLAVFVGAFLAASQRGAYGDSTRVAIAKGALLTLIFGGVVLQLYRPILFFLTFWTT
jgi:hypothetical protein